VIVTALVTACGASPEPRGETTTTPPLPSSTSTTLASGNGLEVIVLPGPDEGFPPDLVVACPGGPSFPIDALDQIRLLDDGDREGFLAAVEQFLENEEGQHWPQEGWSLLHEDDQSAILVASTGERKLAFMFLTREAGDWVWSGSSIDGNPCELQFTVPAGLNTVEWRLDPSAPAPGPEDDTVSVLITERQCVSGQEIGDRLLGPQVVMTDSEVLIAFAAVPPPGDFFTCQGNPETAYLIELSEPFGDRELVKGLDIGISLEEYLD